MSPILEDPAVRRQVFPVSVDFYHQAGALGWLGEDVELLEGVIVKKMSKSPLHEGLVRRLLPLLNAAVPPDCFVAKETPITCAQSEPAPDLAVVRGDPEYLCAHPNTAELVIEVSISTEELDRRKAAIYAQACVREYWLVEPTAGRVILWSKPEGGEYRKCETFDSTQAATSVVMPGFRILLQELLQD